MERRYLVAALAIIATFAVFSHGFRTLEHVSLLYGQQVGADLKAKCNADASAASRFMGKVRTHLRPGYPEEAQMLGRNESAHCHGTGEDRRGDGAAEHGGCPVCARNGAA